MINVSNKISTLRFARAGGSIKTREDVIRKIVDDEIEKGDVLEVSRVAGIQAAKKTSELLIFCHNLPLEWVDITFHLDGDTIHVKAEAEAIARTGVEMEALTAASTALLNIYDMLKPLDKEMEISSIRLLEKTGGKSDFDDEFDHPVKAALVRISDNVADGTREDNSTSAVEDVLDHFNVEVAKEVVIRSGREEVAKKIKELADSNDYHLLFTIGATGLDHGDIVAEITKKLIEYEVPGIPEAMREFGRNRTPYANYSRTAAGVRGGTIIINLPGSSRGAKESVHALFPGLKHALRMMNKGKLRKIE
ncbi:bifunctional molybdenum cofactor biosynthesis protein MoaC/MoaB [Rhodohalobacter sp. SW132]|uniref:bifunctional molybdenum cofactor biosynthesis protein MoaC/MoaB n=1 Tax=Rhodohalobacter sp. SW132 TaxID=2293433 RepID=UPI000E26B5B4|nr:bifunctional molybdenum cofactor biosynthesis protein MoaC/MoaB [Rhodohalobacter sp. SW132]REL38857.1 bifunctional molybdenum cofactor biosynthesis protein MoaC/MoaB [Rhodohalobacter sp. SW132]